jgi:hypothetical protein
MSDLGELAADLDDVQSDAQLQATCNTICDAVPYVDRSGPLTILRDIRSRPPAIPMRFEAMERDELVEHITKLLPRVRPAPGEKVRI